MKPKYWLVLGVASVGASQAAACSSNFDSCADSRTCSKGGGAGESNLAGEAGTSTIAGSSAVAGGAANSVGGEGGLSEAGAAGEGPSEACTADSDCSDGLACSGVEICHLGQCQAGSPPCANPQPGACESVCEEKNGTAVCSVRGADSDKDGHLSSACVANPGDDCDDSAPTVYPGAPELCDGLDNDCNGKADLADGLTAGGSTLSLGGQSLPAIAWAPDKSLYGIMFADGKTANAADLYFEEVDQTGSVKLAPEALNDVTTRSYDHFDITWGGDSFGVAWDTLPGAVYFRTVASNGAVSAGVSHFSVDGRINRLAVARIPGANWGTAYHVLEEGDGDYPYHMGANTISPAGVPGVETRLTFFNAQSLSFGATSTNFITAVSEVAIGSTTLSNSVALRSATLGSPQTVSAFGRSPVVGAGATGFAIATRGATDTDLPQFAAFAANGTSLCGPVSFADKAFVPTRVVATPKGYLVASGGGFYLSDSPLRLQEIFADCSFGPLFTVEPGPVSSVDIAAGSAGFGIVWYDATAKAFKLRMLGPKYCN